MLLTGYGLREWLTILVFGLIAAGATAWFGWWWAVGLVVVVVLALLSFFRDPLGRRPASDDPRDFISPADGVVSAVFETVAHEATGGRPAVVIRIFLSVFNVHVNRSPAEGEVVEVVHRPGKHLDARTEESAIVNESNLVVLRLGSGDTIGVRQVAGRIARRIVCPIAKGAKLARGERYGMIKFGSTTELILPHPAKTAVRVRKGDRVTGGVTILARAAW
jgi:phosphatidylserine decarboxylase